MGSQVPRTVHFFLSSVFSESQVLPGLLSIFISISFALREAADPNSEYSIVDRCFFAALTLAFLTLFRLAVDVNYPFKVGRSTGTTHRVAGSLGLCCS